MRLVRQPYISLGMRYLHPTTPNSPISHLMMASTTRPFALCHRILTSFKPPILTQRRHARTPPAVFEKYRSQLSAKGVLSPSDLSQRTAPEVLAGLSQPPPPAPTPARPRAGVKTLASYVDVPRLGALPVKEIEYVWRARFVADPQSLCAVVPHKRYIQMEADAKQHPMFVLPLPREGQGVEMQFLQWSFPDRRTSVVMFTSLAEYRLRGEWATPHTTVTHHQELAEEKGVVLSQGAVNRDGGVSTDEARWLVIALQKFYGTKKGSAMGGRRRRLLEQFTNGDQGFKVESLISEVEMIE